MSGSMPHRASLEKQQWCTANSEATQEVFRVSERKRNRYDKRTTPIPIAVKR